VNTGAFIGSDPTDEPITFGLSVTRSKSVPAFRSGSLTATFDSAQQVIQPLTSGPILLFPQSANGTD
jgi:hypothetical protein